MNQIVEGYQPPKTVSSRTLFAYGLLDELWEGSLNLVDIDTEFVINAETIDDMLWGISTDPYDVARMILSLEDCRLYHEQTSTQIREVCDQRTKEQDDIRQKRRQLRLQAQPVYRRYDGIYYSLLAIVLIATFGIGFFVLQIGWWWTFLATFIVFLLLSTVVLRQLFIWRDKQLEPMQQQLRELIEPQDVSAKELFEIKKNALLDFWERIHPEATSEENLGTE